MSSSSKGLLALAKGVLGRTELLHFASYYLFTVLAAVVGFVSIPYLTTHIPPEDFGKIGIFLAIVFFMPSLLSFSSNGLQAINIVDQDENAYQEYRNVYITFILILSGTALILSGFAGLWVTDYCFIIITATVYGALQLLGSVHSTELIQSRRSVAFGLFNFITLLLAFLLSVLMISVFKMGWEARIYALIISEAVVLIVRFFIVSDIGKSFRFHVDKELFKEFFHFGWPLMISVLAGWLINQSDRFILLHFFTLKEVGIYSAAFSISSIIATFNQTMIKVVAPPIYQKFNKREGKGFVMKLNAMYAGLILLVAAAGCVALHFGWQLILGAQYEKALPVAYVLCFAQAFFGIYMTLGVVIDYFKENRLKTKIVWFSAVLSIAVSLLLIPALGMFAPAVASLLSFSALAGVTYIAARKILVKYEVK